MPLLQPWMKILLSGSEQGRCRVIEQAWPLLIWAGILLFLLGVIVGQVIRWRRGERHMRERYGINSWKPGRSGKMSDLVSLELNQKWLPGGEADIEDLPAGSPSGIACPVCGDEMNVINSGNNPMNPILKPVKCPNCNITAKAYSYTKEWLERHGRSKSYFMI